MTVLGFSIAAPDLALAWADTAIFRHSEPAGHAAKLIVNPSARLVAAGTGWSSLGRTFGHLAADATSLDRLLEIAPTFLRREAATIAARREDPESFCQNAYFVTGYSERFRCLVGYRLLGESYFAPGCVSAFSSPHDPELEAMGATSFEDLIGTIQAQVITLGLATTGPVIGATLTHAGIATRTLLNLRGGHDPRR